MSFVLTTASFLLLMLLPLSCAIIASFRMSHAPISNRNDRVHLVFEVNEGDSNNCRIHLLDSTTSLGRSHMANGLINATKNTPHNAVHKPELVLEYEKTVQRMHQVKRAKTSLSDKLDVIFHDDSMVVVNKPSGVLCVPDINKNPSLLDLVWEKYGMTDLVMRSNNPSSMIVNRLDMDTSGLVTFGRTKSATRELNEAFRSRSVVKEYEALVCGHVQFDSGLIDLPLQRDHARPPFMRVSTPQSEQIAAVLIDELIQSGYKKQGRMKAKSSQTKFHVVERLYHPSDSRIPLTRLRLLPRTGRTHQLRVHCAAIGHPIVGDPTYGLAGDAAMFGGLEDAILTVISSRTSSSVHSLQRASLEALEALRHVHPPNIQPMCLHAALLRMNHPVTGKIEEWRAPVPF